MSHKTDHPPLPEAFAALGVREAVLRGLAAANFTEPSDIQKLLIPKALTGVDLMGQARTGTGKTAAFGIPILQMASPGVGVQALILVPTRELAVQVEEEIRRIGKHSGIRITSVVGGQRIAGQVEALERNPEIVVGTPGRVIDLLERRLLWLDNIRFIVLDEVDRMLDIGFRDDIRNILARLKNRPIPQVEAPREEVQEHAPEAPKSRTRMNSRPVPKKGNANPEQAPGLHGAAQTHIDAHPEETYTGGHQTIFVSATFTDEIERLARRFMREPVEKLVAPGADEKPTVENVEQYYLTVDGWDKHKALRLLLRQEKPELAIVFCRTKHGAEHLAHSLRVDGIDCREIHGNLKQNARDSVMKGLRGHKFEVLVATDLASRGIDVGGISHIVNYDMPEDIEVYIHRIGRTARMGASGKAYTFVTRDQGEMLTKVENLINMQIPQLQLEGFEPSPPPRGKDRVFAPIVAKDADAPAYKPPPPKQSMLGGKIFRNRRRR
jgi:ATP-dependent RNA helicase DeaD